jgi:fatty acid desaturase
MDTVLKLKPKEVLPFTKKSNIQGALLVLGNWLLIAFAFSLPVLLPYWPSYIISVLLLANRQLGIAILMHDAAHYMLFENKQLNLWIGRFFCGAPVLADLDAYRTYHLKHHKDAGTTNDPDYPNYKSYPVTRTSLVRKVLRDLCGITAIKTLYAIVLMNAGILKYDMVFKQKEATKRVSILLMAKNLIKGLLLPILSNLLLFTFLWSLGFAHLFFLWIIAYFTVYQLFLRIRNAAEHAGVPDLLDRNPLQHARTTKAAWWERLTVAPNYVNYHLEHHLRPNVPCYQLPAFHAYLQQQGVYKEVKIADGYADVVRMLLLKTE